MTTPLTAPPATTSPCCPKCGGLMWDNRTSKRSAKSPDYRCRSLSCDGVIWPPREHAVSRGVEQAEALASEVNNPTADRGGCAARSSVGFLEPGRESETSPIGTSLSRDVVGFPRAALPFPSPNAEYMAIYLRDCRKLMLAWLGQNRELSDFDAAFGLSPDSEQDAVTIAIEAAQKTIARALNVYELRLLQSAVRDFCIMKTALRLAAELRGVVGLLPSGQSGRNRHLAASASCDLADLAERVERGEE